MNSRLSLFLWVAAERRLVWGEWDCGLWLADWYMFGTGRSDPAADVRGKYHDAESCRALCGPLGHARVIQRIAKSAGLARTQEPRPGDIGIIRTRPGTLAMGAIRSNTFWVFLHEHGGLSSVRPDEPSLHVMAAWRIANAGR